MATSKLTNEEKLEELKKFLRENKIRYIENHKSRTFGVTMNLKIRKLNIAVFLSDENRTFEEGIVFAKSPINGMPLRNLYNPFFIRESESMEFILEKMQNCIIKRMTLMQKIWNKKQRKQKKP